MVEIGSVGAGMRLIFNLRRDVANGQSGSAIDGEEVEHGSGVGFRVWCVLGRAYATGPHHRR
jgi:hypothetical protein